MDEFITFNKVRQLYAYGCSSKRFVNKLVEKTIVKRKAVGNKVLYSKEDLDRYVQEVEHIIKNGVALTDLSLHLSGISSNSNNLKKVYEFAKDIGLKETRLPLRINNENDIFYMMESIKKFQNDFISIDNAFNENGMYSDQLTFIKKLKIEGVKFYEMLKFTKTTFIKKSDSNSLININEVIELNYAMQRLSINKDSFYAELKDKNILTIRGFKKKVFIKKNDFKVLLNKQAQLSEEFEMNYYDLDEIKDLVRNEGLVKEKGELLASLTKVEIPNLLRTQRYKNKSILYNKQEFDEYLKVLRFNNESKNILLDFNLDSISTYFELLKLNGIDINGLKNITWNEWFKHVNSELKFAKKVRASTKNLIIKLKNTTITLYQFNRGNEIYDFKNAEIKLALFSSEVPIVYRMEIRKFLNILNKVLVTKGIRTINTSDLIVGRARVGLETGLYSYEEYKIIYNTVKDLSRHISYIINNKVLNNQNSVYIEFWLYSLLHIFTALRSQNAIDFKANIPELLTKYNIKTIYDLNERNITDDTLEEIIFYVCSVTYIHTKNNTKALIYCPEELKRSFAYALICYQLKMASSNIVKVGEIILESNKFPDSVVNSFFGENIEFKSKKMNKTLMTLVDQVESEIYNNSVGEAAATLRGHKRNSVSTGKYIIVTQERLDATLSEVYDIGFFGYLYENLVKFTKSNFEELEFDSKYEIIKGMNNIFGDTLEMQQIIEDIIKSSDNDMIDIKDYFENNNKTKIINDYMGIVSGINISKTKNISCLFKNCVDMIRDCENCVFHVPHFYSVNVLIKELFANLELFKSIEFSEGMNGYKKKIYNLIIRDLKQLIFFSKKYGKESIEYLMTKDFDEFKGQMLKLQKPK
ncbi:hypothetical protein CSE16_13890 [Solibacillus sp. R5-41]|uniref:hypothetical protein n=1 Tax=Solibacillus sp. R5-41 TaxID=2048654 RepID=UPI000C12938E|nr:hypothetical protein [Solibacillus sp. R5-41]ATP41053.1 hypothetical protein CSE16_13890 [Solibacillus sp. R5-41]